MALLNNPALLKALRKCDENVDGGDVANLYSLFSTRIHQRPIGNNLVFPDHLSDAEKCLTKELYEYLRQNKVNMNKLRIRTLGTKALYEEYLQEMYDEYEYLFDKEFFGGPMDETLHEDIEIKKMEHKE